MRFTIVAVLLSLTLAFTGCGGPKDSDDQGDRISVVLDTDIGTDIDDTWALAYLLNCPELDLKMVLTSSGDTEYRAKVAAKFLEVAKRTDIPVAIGAGSGPGTGANFQEPWVEDYELENYPGQVFSDGVEAFVDFVNESPKPVVVIAIGTLPSLKAALEIDPGIAEKIRFCGMHGSIDKGYGGSEEISAEANVKYDVPAFRAVLESEIKQKEITPLDTCGLVILEGERYQKLLSSNDPMLQALFENYRIWGKLVNWMEVDDTFIARQSSTLFDLVAVQMAFDHSLLEFDSVPIRVTDDGYTIRDADGIPIEAALQWKDLDAFYEIITLRLLGK